MKYIVHLVKRQTTKESLRGDKIESGYVKTANSLTTDKSKAKRFTSEHDADKGSFYWDVDVWNGDITEIEDNE